jgi:hypothetical protein
MSHAAAVFCIHVPTLEASAATHSARNNGSRNAAVAEAPSLRSGATSAASAPPVRARPVIAPR